MTHKRIDNILTLTAFCILGAYQMNTTMIEPTNSVSTLTQAIQIAMAKLNLSNEAHLSHYIPDEEGRRLHHLTIKRLKKENPKQLRGMLEKFILFPDKPQLLPTRIRQGKQISISFSRSQLNQLIDVVTASGDEDLINLLRPYQSFEEVQRQFKQMASNGEFDPVLVEIYRRLAKNRLEEN